MTSPTWRALGQVVLVYFAISGSAVTAQDVQPGRATFSEMVAFARVASITCERLTPDVEGVEALALQRLVKPPLTEKEIGAKEKEVKRLRPGIAERELSASGSVVEPGRRAGRVYGATEED